MVPGILEDGPFNYNLASPQNPPIYLHTGLWASPPDANCLKACPTPGLGEVATRASVPGRPRCPSGAAELPIVPAAVAESQPFGLKLGHH
jgi:hypothetical protein